MNVHMHLCICMSQAFVKVSHLRADTQTLLSARYWSVREPISISGLHDEGFPHTNNVPEKEREID